MRLEPQTCAVTAVTFERLRLFQRHANAQLFIETLLRYRDASRFLLHGFVVMPDHVHILLTPAESIEKAAGLIKGGFSFAVRGQYNGDVWQKDYHAHRCVDAEDYAAQLGYIASNALKKRYVNYPFVHTTGAWRLDPPPAAMEKRASPGG